MNRAQHETTERINRDELYRLLNTMTPAEEQQITTRARISDIQEALGRAQAVSEAAPTSAANLPGRGRVRSNRKTARAAKKAAKRAAAEAAATAEELQAAATELAELATTTTPSEALSNGVPHLFNNVDWDELLTTAVSAMLRPLTPASITPPSEGPRANRKYARPFSQVAALLPAVEPPRRARTSMPALPRAKTDVRSLAIPEQRAARTVAEVRARLDSGQGIGASPSLSTQVVEQLSAEEIAMLPMAIRLRLPEVSGSKAVSLEAPRMPRANLAAAPTAAAAPVRASSAATILASFSVLLLVGICAIYFLL
ncbi:MAG: hypothetical protein H0T46_35995 [Deltaproteobacteria bacterium]|nr:hypothetical protein [Deltaproteobacteria bacterium]